MIPIVKDNTPSLEMDSEKAKRLPMLMLGKDLNKVSQPLESLAILLKDIQLLLDGEMMLILLLQVSSVSNHIVLQESLIHQLTH